MDGGPVTRLALSVCAVPGHVAAEGLTEAFELGPDTLTVAVAVQVHKPLPVVTEYPFVLLIGETVIDCVVAPVFQLYGAGPLAVSTVDVPQIGRAHV